MVAVVAAAQSQAPSKSKKGHWYCHRCCSKAERCRSKSCESTQLDLDVEGTTSFPNESNVKIVVLLISAFCCNPLTSFKIWVCIFNAGLEIPCFTQVPQTFNITASLLERFHSKSANAALARSSLSTTFFTSLVKRLRHFAAAVGMLPSEVLQSQNCCGMIWKSVGGVGTSADPQCIPMHMSKQAQSGEV